MNEQIFSDEFKDTKTLVVTPLKNEVSNIPCTINAMTSQTLRPTTWIIVDDGSTDGSKDIVLELIRYYNWVKMIDMPGSKSGIYSKRVVEVFYYGLSQINLKEFDFIVKLDADVSFESHFFSQIITSFKVQPKLGIASGTMMHNGSPEKFLIDYGGETRGATKFYRRECFEQIGGIVPEYSWDSLDNAGARALGWRTEQLPFYFTHLKKEGSRVGNKLKLNFLSGVSNGNIPYYFPFFLMKSIYRSRKFPYFLNFILENLGFFYSKLVRRRRPFPKFATEQLRLEQKESVKIIIKMRLFDVWNLWNN